ncbi:MAG: tRNA (adenosine(37)-N6)-dimethylallyltransferase MiaA [Magnetococcales bacterium]|nr:tRNA (adenosine(37)-N6)-dimethylallyltransferase MiaA [Magnetococcales bacterium]MBF0113672.1 tRNA (adenosine(37)-N6)-dimethylallyltransferase MiaA [Magnetococcales bacterium]
MGPTASGKSALAMHLAQAFAMEIVNADSVQLYRGLAIGSAKPSLEERQLVPHHLLDLTTPDHPFSADRYREMAWQIIAECQQRRRTPLFVGGSGLYFRAVASGLVLIPPMDPVIRQRIKEEGVCWGWPVMHQRLRQVDPELAARLTLNDGQRISQGLAVHAATGRPLSQWQREQPPPPPFSILKMAPLWPREQLYARIEARFDLMMEQGLLEEARHLLQAGYDRQLPAMKAVGYRQLFPYLEGELSLVEAVLLAKQESRRYAKRQMTWLRKEADLRWLPPEGVAEATCLVADFLRQE